MLNGNPEEYSIVFKEKYYDYSFEEPQIAEAIIASINFICFDGLSKEEALPYVAFASGADGRKLGKLNWLLYSTIWSHHGYLWLYDYLKTHKEAKCLDIGPGFGLLSCVFLDLFKELRFHYLILGDDPQKELESDSWFDEGLYKASKRFERRVTYNYGMIEKDDNSIDGEYDVIILTEVFEHFVFNPIPTMKRIASALREDGIIMLTTPNWNHLVTYRTWEDLPEASSLSDKEYLKRTWDVGHVYQYTKSELDDIFERCGLRVLDYNISDGKNHNYWLAKDI